MELNFPKIEEKILKFWEKNKIFEKSISQRKGRPFFSFYDGPPFATGKPHYGHILATTIKDTILRYRTMRGYQVPWRVGWDCHGLPVENLIEKELGIKNKKEIGKLGIEKFNLACRKSVFRCVKDFEKNLKRVGRWADYKNAYATLNNDYIESVWWVLKQLWDRNLVYRDYRVAPYCPRCGTPLSNFEVNQGYKEVKDPSIFIKFKIQESANFKEEPTYFLVWTTTPWTLPGNVALAIQPKANYILVKQDNENYILAEARKEILKGEFYLVKKFLGKELVGLRYKPIFDSLLLTLSSQRNGERGKNVKNAFCVLPADFVSLEEGTGIVHIAVMYGEEDFQLGKKFNLPFQHTVDEDGFFKKEVKEFSGKFVKEADPEIIKNLAERGILYKKEEIFHSYPFCWRCDTPLLYYAIESWYIRVTKIKKQLIENNKKIHWLPSHIKEGRFGQWLKEAKDWAFSRNRFWGAPIPIWQCQGGKFQNSNSKEELIYKQVGTHPFSKEIESQPQNSKTCGNLKVISSVKELEKLSRKKIKDLHRPYIDDLTFKCDKCGGVMKRISEVFDCWFESGAMPYGQWHYPFENKKLVEKTFPADFIAEGLDQTRGWFYTLHILATALTLKNIGLGKSQPAFLNVIVNGLILDAQGRKLSKKLGNYPEPKEIFDSYGADSLRYFLLASTPIGQDYRFSTEGVREVWNKIVSTLYHSYLFSKTYQDKKFRLKRNFKPTSLLNKWIISSLNNLNFSLIKLMDSYELTKASRLFGNFIDELSNWYIRRSRRRFQKPENEKEREEFSQTLANVLFILSKLAAPFLPFISEYLYQNLKLKKDYQSVHLCDYPKGNKKLINKKLERKMEKVREIVNLALAERAKAKIKVRQPLNELKIKDYELKNPELLELIREEVNVKKITFGKSFKLNTEITPELKEEGIVREVIRQIQEMRKSARLKPKDRILVQYWTNPSLDIILNKNKSIILRETFAKDFEMKEELKGTKRELKIDNQKLELTIKKL